MNVFSWPLFFSRAPYPKTQWLKTLKTQLDMTWATSCNIVLALLWGGSWTACLLEVPCNPDHPQFLCLQNTGPFQSATHCGRRNLIPESYSEVYEPKMFFVYPGMRVQKSQKGNDTCIGLGDQSLVYLLKLIASTSKALPQANGRCLVLGKGAGVTITVMQDYPF